MRPASGARPDVLVVGDGIIGLSVSVELARRGATVHMAGARRPGVASEAGAGLLAPSIGSVGPRALPFYLHSLSLFPEFVAALGGGADLLTYGLIELGAAEVAGAPARAQPQAQRLSPGEVAALEPALSAPDGAWYHPDDAAVHLPNLVAELRRRVDASTSISRLPSEAVSIDAAGPRPKVLLKNGTSFDAHTVVLAAGAWTPLLGGLPRPIPVRPLKGEIISLDRCPLRASVLAGHVYLVPRGDATVVGATSDDVGFNVERSAFIATMLHRQAVEVVPSLEGARVSAHWAGLRPATPDMLPIIGRDPDAPNVVYACGHGRNGILLAPATARVVASLCEAATPEVPIDEFAVDRPALVGEKR